MILVIFSLRKKSIKIIIARIFRALQKLTRLFIHFRLILVASAVNLKVTSEISSNKKALVLDLDKSTWISIETNPPTHPTPSPQKIKK